MIFVTVGTDRFQFNRLIQAVDEYCARENRQAFIQLGSSDYRPQHCQWTKFLPFEEVRSLVCKSSIIISHAGVGTIFTCITNGKMPLVAPRLSQFGEAIDDHQVEFAHLMQRRGYTEVIDLKNLTESLTRRASGSVAHLKTGNADLIDYLDKLTIGHENYRSHHGKYAKERL